ncbi:phosphopantetheine-binding protein [Amycolatopsis sp. FBCC-B4732]|uniref:acyl carrier protein n=1 Tax=Amycolatopsis sp. FBCC-B4732 TaxID=3079339 RepID=UPI001FF6F197|nr:acyl carrier protein [Amycolatopsis sp. FBCC-B4732]UOX90004.1 phosphopantetheine-binding protein [Amycolatopsis sp. FBCC-B4732]
MPRSPHAADHVAALTTIWREVLRNDHLDATADLFENGGTSLHVLQIVGRIYDTLGVEVRPRHVFLHASPQDLTAFLVEDPASERPAGRRSDDDRTHSRPRR